MTVIIEKINAHPSSIEKAVYYHLEHEQRIGVLVLRFELCGVRYSLVQYDQDRKRWRYLERDMTCEEAKGI